MSSGMDISDQIKELLLKKEKQKEISREYVKEKMVKMGYEVKGPYTWEQVEAIKNKEAESFPNFVERLPFGFIHDKWLDLRRKSKLGDDFFWYSGINSKVKGLRRESGYILVRNGKVLGKIVSLRAYQDNSK